MLPVTSSDLTVQVIDECLGLTCGHDEKSVPEPIKLGR